jgi:hypothetical protein
VAETLLSKLGLGYLVYVWTSTGLPVDISSLRVVMIVLDTQCIAARVQNCLFVLEDGVDQFNSSY